MSSEQLRKTDANSVALTDLNLKSLNATRMANLMKQSFKELDTIISDNIEKLGESIDRIKVKTPLPQAPLRKPSRTPSTVSSCGDGKVDSDGGPPPLSHPPKKFSKLDEYEKDFLSIPTPIVDSATVETKVIPPPKRQYSAYSDPIPLSLNPVTHDAFTAMTSSMAMLRFNLVRILENNASVYQMDTDTETLGKNLQVLKSALRDNRHNITVLDFRTLNDWLKKYGRQENLNHRKPNSLKSQQLVMPQEELDSAPEPPTVDSIFPVDFTPPNEFDWFTYEKMNTILSLSAASKIFALLKQAKCTEKLKEVYMNATNYTEDYDADDDDVSDLTTFDVKTISETLSSMKNLTKLVLRGMCEDEMLKTIGHNCHLLFHLDVSGSPKVTDTGIQNLVFHGPNEGSAAVYLIYSWVLSNLDKMNPIVKKLKYLDYSLTSVSTVGRKLCQYLPGCYLFKRLTSTRKDDDYGHHIFIRELVLFKSIIPAKLTTAFEKNLGEVVGMAGAKAFTKLVASHPWRNYFITIYSNISEFDLKNSNAINLKDVYFWGVVTPNENEKRIQGVIQWCNNYLTQVYTIYPINLTLLGSLNTVKAFQGIVHGSWRTQFSLLPELAQLDIFTEPKTFASFIQYCPCLRRVTVRIRGAPLKDEHIISIIRNCMCRNSLEKFWLASASTGSIKGSTGGSHVNSLSPSLRSSLSTLAENSEQVQGVGSGSSLDLYCGTFVETDDLVQLSLDCLQTLVTTCPNLKRVGDLATWSNVDEEELYTYCETLKQKRNKIVITWANINLPPAESGKKKRVKM